MIFAGEPQVDLAELFGNVHPVEIEIGFGKGAFLVASAEARRDVNFLGLENQAKYAKLVQERIERRALRNARAMRADAALIVAHFLRDDSVRAYHLYFPDPWWKRRHHKRRLLTSALAAHLYRTLQPGGTLWLSTDVAHRFDEMLEAASGQPFVLRRGAVAPGRPLTNFERKYRAQGRTLFHAALDKAGAPVGQP